MTEATVTPADRTIRLGLALLLAVALTITLLVAIAGAQSGPSDPAVPAPITSPSRTAPPLADCRVPPAVAQAEGMRRPADCLHPRTTHAPWDRIR